jgi:GNAT superfamily N-acetyltransferase
MRYSEQIRIRTALESDADVCGRICFEGFRELNERHGFPPAFPSVEIAVQRVRRFIQHPSFFGVVAEGTGKRTLGFNFLSERDPIRAVGPIVINPAVQGRGIGRLLMEAVLKRAHGALGVRLLQATYNVQSLSLYASLGFDTREYFMLLAGSPISGPSSGWEIRSLAETDVTDCEALHRKVHGYTRTNELREAIAAGTATLALRGGRVRAYMTAPAVWVENHGVAETDEDMQSLLLGVAQMKPISFFMPPRHATLFRWCLTQGFRAVRPMTLMTFGAYREPQGSYFPSVQY